MVVWGAQRPDVNLPKYTHTFATFLKVTGECCCGPECPHLTEHFTISWLPRDAVVQTWRLLPQPGANYDLYSTLKLLTAEGEQFALWGPFAIDRSLYCRAVTQKALLEGGAVRYKAADTGYPTARVSNCIHAVSDLAEDSPRLRVASPGWGWSASYYVTRHLSPWFLDRRPTHDWVLAELGLAGFCIRRMDLEAGNPTEGPLLRGLQALPRRGLPR